MLLHLLGYNEDTGLWWGYHEQHAVSVVKLIGNPQFGWVFWVQNCPSIGQWMEDFLIFRVQMEQHTPFFHRDQQFGTWCLNSGFGVYSTLSYGSKGTHTLHSWPFQKSIYGAKFFSWTILQLFLDQETYKNTMAYLCSGENGFQIALEIILCPKDSQVAATELWSRISLHIFL